MDDCDGIQIIKIECVLMDVCDTRMTKIKIKKKETKKRRRLIMTMKIYDVY